MNRMSKKLAAASLISACTTVSALAGSVTQPGETVGVAAGAPAGLSGSLPAEMFAKWPLSDYRSCAWPRTLVSHIPTRF